MEAWPAALIRWPHTQVYIDVAIQSCRTHLRTYIGVFYQYVAWILTRVAKEMSVSCLLRSVVYFPVLTILRPIS